MCRKAEVCGLRDVCGEECLMETLANGCLASGRDSRRRGEKRATELGKCVRIAQGLMTNQTAGADEASEGGCVIGPALTL